jgi:hypothetical protein
MEEKFDAAIENTLAMIRANCKPDEALKFSQAALNLANAKTVMIHNPPPKK